MKTIKNLFILSFLSLLSSCNEQETQLIKRVSETKNNKELLSINFAQEGLSIKTLGYLKEVSDIAYDLVEYYEQESITLLEKKRLKKTLNKLFKENKFCSNRILTSTEISKLNEHCEQGGFNICPYTFKNYEKNIELIKNEIGVIMGLSKNEYQFCMES